MNLPPPEKMAELVSGVTQTMLGFSFAPVAQEGPRGLAWKTALLPIDGEVPLTVGLSSDQEGCSKLAGALFSCPRDEVDAAMMDDSLCELVNMTAGLLKSAMSLNQALGLPRIFAGAYVPPVPPPPQVVVLKAESVGLVLWIYEGVA